MGINTLEIANRLKAAEREGRTAEEIALVFQEVFEQQLGQLVTKDYLHAELDRLKAELRSEIAELRGEMQVLRADMEKMELRLTNALTMRMAALVAGAVAVLGGLNIFF
ncbi:MAG: hypothetical protein KatS3mg117_3006 [Geminicoccaceae bacterium]|jgi:hypothetical protein|nr:MAG: hypothetical protein KatS3mg117_3006 [Geminicoccaceae bacterium]